MPGSRSCHSYGSGGGRTLLFDGHTDVVPPGDIGAWTGDPFIPRTMPRDGRDVVVTNRLFSVGNHGGGRESGVGGQESGAGFIRLENSEGFAAFCPAFDRLSGSWILDPHEPPR